MKEALESLAWIILMIVIISAVLLSADQYSKENKKGDLCWDDSGKRYVAPDSHCTYGAYK